MAVTAGEEEVVHLIGRCGAVSEGMLVVGQVTWRSKARLVRSMQATDAAVDPLKIRWEVRPWAR